MLLQLDPAVRDGQMPGEPLLAGQGSGTDSSRWLGSSRRMIRADHRRDLKPRVAWGTSNIRSRAIVVCVGLRAGNSKQRLDIEAIRSGRALGFAHMCAQVAEVPEDGELRELALDELRPDHYNPRFPPQRQGSFADDEEVYRYVDREYDSHHIADSIARHGYFLAEPLIAMPAEDGEGWTVLEGNRRLAALKGLSDENRRKSYPERRWQHLPRAPKLPSKYTVFVVPDRAKVAPILGFRHITGIAPWEPYAQARYVAQLVDDEGRALDEIPELIGRSPAEVKSYYRNYWIVEQAVDEFDIPDVERVLQEFGVWTRAMTNPTLRGYIGAPDPRDVDPKRWPIPDDHAAELAEVITWLYGGPRDNDGKPSQRPAITDSRHITRLGRVVAIKRGLDALRGGADLPTAERATEDPADAFVERLQEALDALEEATATRPDGKAPARSLVLLEECLERLEALREHYASGTAT